MAKVCFFHYTAKSQKIKGVLLSFLIFALFATATLLPFFKNRESAVLFPEERYFLLCFYEGKDATKAKSAADSLILRGGAGNIVEEGGVYGVYACAYGDYESAAKVQKNVAAAGGECFIRPLSVPKISAKSEGENALLRLAREGFITAYEGLTACFKNAEKGRERAAILSDLSAAAEKAYALEKTAEKTDCENAERKAQAQTFLSGCVSSLRALLMESTRASLSVGGKQKQLAVLFSYRAFLGAVGG